MENNKALCLEHLVVKHGPGCPICEKDSSHMERNRCPYCRTIWAVRDVSLNVYQGEILGVVGESGSGKSTLMKALYLDQEPSSGSYFLDCFKEGRQDIYSASVQQKKYIKNYLLGMVYQNPHLGLRMFFSTGANVAEKLIAAGNRNVASMMEKTEELLSHMKVPVNRVKEPPGIGKSSLLKCIYRSYLPTEGEILYTKTDGSVLDLATAGNREILSLRREEMGYVPLHLQRRREAETQHSARYHHKAALPPARRTDSFLGSGI